MAAAEKQTPKGSFRGTEFLSKIGQGEYLDRLLGGAAAWPFVVEALQPGKLPAIGFLGANTAATQRQWTDAFLQRLAGRRKSMLGRHAGGA